jgi:predicted metalloprotease
MRLGGRRESGNVEDRRGMSRGVMLGGGGLGTVAVVLIAMFLGVDPGQLMEITGAGQPAPAQQQSGPREPRADDALATFSRQVLASNEDVWSQVMGRRFSPPVLVLYDGQTDAGRCGTGQAAMGPFYCPPDQKLYVDLAFFRELDRKLGAPGDFAQAYVIAHEVGHHIQSLTGVSQESQRAMRGASPTRSNQISVRVELQADCYAGVWAHHASNLLEPGDIEEGLTAAAAVGDDALQAKMQGRVVPDSFTHGTSEQRARWFGAGFQSGRMESCDTFNAGSV